MKLANRKQLPATSHVSMSAIILRFCLYTSLAVTSDKGIVHPMFGACILFVLKTSCQTCVLQNIRTELDWSAFHVHAVFSGVLDFAHIVP